MTVDRLAAMEAFVRVVDAGSFSDAAKPIAHRPAHRFQDDRAARRLAWRPVIVAFDAPRDAD